MTFGTYLRHVGLNIKAARVKAELRQADVEEKTGINYRYYQRIEAGKVNLTLETLYRLAKAFKTNIEEFTKH